MTDSYKEMLQVTATRVWEARTEYDRARQEKNAADRRFEETAKKVRDYEGQLGKAVGPNMTKRMWLVATGIAVVAEYRDNSATLVHVLEAEPQE